MYKIEIFEVGVKEDQEIVSKLNEFYKDGWELVYMEKFSEFPSDYNSKVIYINYIKFLLKRLPK